MANCTYLTDQNGNAIVCPEETPEDTRCAICLLLYLIDKGLHIPKPKPIPAKLPS